MLHENELIRIKHIVNSGRRSPLYDEVNCARISTTIALLLMERAKCLPTTKGRHTHKPIQRNVVSPYLLLEQMMGRVYRASGKRPFCVEVARAQIAGAITNVLLTHAKDIAAIF